MSTSKASDNSLLEKELIITKTELPFFRAGNGLFFILLTGVWLYIGSNIIKHFQVQAIGSIILFFGSIYFLFKFLSYVSKIIFYPDRFKIITAIFEKDIYVEEIEKIKISIVPLNSYITLKFKLKNKKFPLSFSFVVMKNTNLGEYKQTLEELEQIIIRHGIPYKKSLDILEPIKKFTRKNRG